VTQVLPARGLWDKARARNASERLILLLLQCIHDRRATPPTAVAARPPVGMPVDLFADHALDIHLRILSFIALVAAGPTPLLVQVDLCTHPTHKVHLLSAHLLCYRRLNRARG